MNESILISIKKLLGIAKDYNEFDADIIMHINSVFMILNQLGVGPETCFRIEDDLKIWDEFVTATDDLDAVKSYIHLKVKLLFDPPPSSSAIESTKQLISELEWRLTVQVDSKKTKEV